MPLSGQYPLGAELQLIEQLPWTLDGRYNDEGDETLSTVWPDITRTGKVRCCLGVIRRGNLPMMEQDGVLSDLNIPTKAGLAELTYVVQFGKGVLGVLNNVYGPRVTKLTEYLRVKAQASLPQPFLKALLRPDVSQQIERLLDIRLLDIGVHQSELTHLEEYDTGSLSQLLRGAAEIGNAKRIRLILQPEARAGEGLNASVASLAARLSRIPHVGRIFHKFAVKGYDPLIDAKIDIDVLRDLMVSRQQVVFEDSRSRALSATSAYAAIERAFSEIEPELARAAEASLT